MASEAVFCVNCPTEPIFYLGISRDEMREIAQFLKELYGFYDALLVWIQQEVTRKKELLGRMIELAGGNVPESK
jgi:hypothetical protein